MSREVEMLTWTERGKNLYGEYAQYGDFRPFYSACGRFEVIVVLVKPYVAWMAYNRITGERYWPDGRVMQGGVYPNRSIADAKQAAQNAADRMARS